MRALTLFQFFLRFSFTVQQCNWAQSMDLKIKFSIHPTSENFADFAFQYKIIAVTLKCSKSLKGNYINVCVRE